MLVSSLDSPCVVCVNIACVLARSLAGAGGCGIVNEKTVAKQEVVEIASASGINCEKFFSEFFSQARLHLGDGMSDSQYSFEAVGRRPNTMRVHISRSIPLVYQSPGSSSSVLVLSIRIL